MCDAANSRHRDDFSFQGQHGGPSASARGAEWERKLLRRTSNQVSSCVWPNTNPLGNPSLTGIGEYDVIVSMDTFLFKIQSGVSDFDCVAFE